MTDTDRELSLQDEDRLPWLEAVKNDNEDEGLSGGKLLAFLFAGLLGIGVLVGGIWWLRGQQQGPVGDGTLIVAQAGDYKVKPGDPGGMKVEGQGDSAFAASEGAEADGRVDVGALPETPVTVVKDTRTAAAVTPVAPAKSVISTSVAPSSGTLMPPASVGGGGLVQFGAYGSQASANEAWTKLSGRNPELMRLTKSILPAAVGGKMFYRLRADAGTPAAAAALCNNVGNCIVVK